MIMDLVSLIIRVAAAALLEWMGRGVASADVVFDPPVTGVAS
jgi:hypothetical protein